MALVSLRRGGAPEAPHYDGPVLGGPLSEHDPGLCIAFNREALTKLDLDEDAKPGDMLHMNILIEVTHVTHSPDNCRIEAAIIGGEVEDEMHEDEDE